MKRRRWLGALALAALPWAAGCAQGFFFAPNRRDYRRPADLGLDAEDVFFDAEDGSRLHAWWLPARGAAIATVVHAHGNGANIGNHLPSVAWLPPAGCNVLTFDYRGYGRSTGEPSLDGVVADTRAAVKAARARVGTASALVVLGQSLGGSTALRAVADEHAAGARDIRLAIVEAAFDSYRGIALEATEGELLSLVTPLALPSLPPRERDPVAAAARLGTRLLLIHSEADESIPVAHGERLFAAAAQPKTFLRLKQVRHLHAFNDPATRSQVLAAIAEAAR